LNACKEPPVALDARCIDAKTAPRERPDGLVVEGGRTVQRLERGEELGTMAVGLHHQRLLVAEDEFDHAVLEGLEARRCAELFAKRGILRGRECRQNIPRLDQLREDARDAREHLKAGCRSSARTRSRAAVSSWIMSFSHSSVACAAR